MAAVAVLLAVTATGLRARGTFSRAGSQTAAGTSGAGLIASGAVLAALALHQVSSAWLTVVGLGAATGAYLIALPLGRGSRRGSDVDVE